MSKLIYISNTSLDGYIEDQSGAFDWGYSDQVFPLVTELLRSIGTHVYGRRLYETMAYWAQPIERYPLEYREFARIWQQADKIVFSRTLEEATTPNTRVARAFDVETMQKLKRDSEQDLFIGGAELASAALEAGLVDECHLLLHPVILGAGKPAFRAGSRHDFQLLDMHRVGTGITHLHYHVIPSQRRGTAATAQ